MPGSLSRSVAVAACLAALVLGVRAARAQDTPGTLVSKGPIPHRNSEPLNTPFLAPQPTDGFVLSKGRARFGVGLDIVNNLLTDREGGRQYFTDFEEQRLSVQYSRGIGAGQEVGIRVGYVARNGGILDTFVNNWHRLFGLKGGGRDDLPDYRTLFRVTGDGAGRAVVDSTRKESGLTDTVLEYRYALTTLPADAQSTRAVAATVRALVKLPTGRSGPLFGSGGFDAGVGVALTARPNRRLALHGNATLVVLGDPRNENIAVRRSLVHSLLAVEYLWDGRTSLVAQTDDNPAPFRSGLAYPDRPRRGFTLGVWRQISGPNRVYLSLTENDFGPLAKHAPDFTLSLGAQWGL